MGWCMQYQMGFSGQITNMHRLCRCRTALGCDGSSDMQSEPVIQHFLTPEHLRGQNTTHWRLLMQHLLGAKVGWAGGGERGGKGGEGAGGGGLTSDPDWTPSMRCKSM